VTATAEAKAEAAPARTYPSVVHMLAEAATLAAEQTALVCGDSTLDYREYARCVGGFANKLIGLGARGERIALVIGNSMEMAIATFAVHAAGAQVVPINPMYTAREMRPILADADPIAVVHDSAAAELVTEIAAELAIADRIAVGPGGEDLLGWRSDDRAALPDPLPAAGDPATLQYTGGTTGRSKGVNLSHGAIATNITQRETLTPSQIDKERMLCVMPLFHIYASHCCLQTMAYARGTLVIEKRYHPGETLRALARHKITIFAGSPTIFSGLMAFEDFAQADLSSLRFSYSGSAPLPEEVLNRWEAATGTPIVEGYGQSEAGPVLTYNPLHGTRKAGSVGVALPQTELQIVDTETGAKVLGTGEVGEIRARGPQIMRGYRNLPAETDEALRDGWLYTGDIGEFDGDGYLFIRDRKKDMVICGGYNVYPREIDEVLYGHHDVLEAAAIGVPDDYRGEVIKAFVALKPGAGANAEDLLAYCRANLARYKLPAEIALCDELPKTSVGKIDKKALKPA